MQIFYLISNEIAFLSCSFYNISFFNVYQIFRIQIYQFFSIFQIINLQLASTN